MSADGSRTAELLGYGGLIPFVGLSLGLVFGIDVEGVSERALLIGYAVTILSFLGAIHWGVAVASPDANSSRDFVASVVPPLFAWIALALAPPADLLALAVAFPGWYLWERVSILTRYPAWFRRLRAILTIVVTVSLASVVAFA
ncbi:MAG: DUF3429 domain-containing protein [Pseudomonadota bacterium]